MVKSFVRQQATSDDYNEFTRFFDQLATGDQVPSREQWEEELMPRTFFLLQDSTKIAYALVHIMGQHAHIAHVVVDAPFRKQGIGHTLMNVILDDCQSASLETAHLNVKVDNTAAIHLYETFGFSTSYAATSLKLRWADLAHLPQEHITTVASKVEPQEDPVVEAAFSLPAGLMANHRTRSDRLLLKLRDQGTTLLGFASFSPSFPGCSPFRVIRPSLARPLLDAIKPHALPIHDHIHLMIEADKPLDQVLRDAGATVRLDILHMEKHLGKSKD